MLLVGDASWDYKNPTADDAHYADDKTLDAIEYATATGEDVRLWVVACAHPRLHRRRPRWGERALVHHAAELKPLAESDAMQMAAELLRRLK